MRAERRRGGAAWLMLALLLPTACVTVSTVNIGSKTALEHQLMGALIPLDDEALQLATVRLAAAEGAGDALAKESGPLVEAHQAAVAARQRQLFNRDDLLRLKAAGCLGEARTAALAARPCGEAQAEAAGIARLLAEENADRETVLAWLRLAEPALAGPEGRALPALYAEIWARAAAPGDWLERPDGRWERTR